MNRIRLRRWAVPSGSAGCPLAETEVTRQGGRLNGERYPALISTPRGAQVRVGGPPTRAPGIGDTQIYPAERVTDRMCYPAFDPDPKGHPSDVDRNPPRFRLTYPRLLQLTFPPGWSIRSVVLSRLPFSSRALRSPNLDRDLTATNWRTDGSTPL